MNLRHFGLAGMLLAFSQPLFGFTASKVYMTALYNGWIRVTVLYTPPEVKQVREAHTLFRSKKEAETFYWKLIRGADFYPGDSGQAVFLNHGAKPDPW